MDQMLHLTPPIAAGLAALLGAALGYVAPFQRRTLALVAHSLLAAIAATSVRGAASVHAWTLPRIEPDYVMGVVIAALCLVGVTTTFRARAGLLRHLASSALLVFTGVVGLLAGSGEAALAAGAAAVAFLALVAPDPPVVVQERAQTGRVAVSVPQHSSPRLP
jgi:hypothetical protein